MSESRFVQAHATVVVACLLVGTSGCASRQPQATLVAGAASASLNAANSLAISLLVLNQGTADAEDVSASSISLDGATLSDPMVLPYAVGTIAKDGTTALQATFANSSFTPGANYTMKVSGTFDEQGHEFKFSLEQSVQIPPTTQSSMPSKSASSAVHSVSGAHFPHQAPNFPKEVNSSGQEWTVPNGPEQPPAPQSSQSGVQPAPSGDPGQIDFETNNGLGFYKTGESPNEPSGAVSSGGVTFETANSYGSYSNGGATFTKIDPTTVFPQSDGGFCCDQIVQYVPGIDRFVWVMQYSAGATGLNRYRIAVASPATVLSSEGKSWRYFDIATPQVTGVSCCWFDYPDASFGNSYFYVSGDIVKSAGAPSNSPSGRFVVRVRLSEIQSMPAQIGWDYYISPSHTGGAHLSENALDEVYWAGEPNNSSFEILGWPESSSNVSAKSVNIANYTQGTCSSLTPDQKNWFSHGFPRNAVLGATRLQSRKQNELLLAWTACSGHGFSQPHVNWVALDLNNDFKVISQNQVWNANYAYGYPAFGVNSNGDIGMSLEYGGGGNYETHVVGFWGDFVVYGTASSTVGTGRFGDYVTIRPYSPDTARFAAFGYGITNLGYNTRYVVFSRPHQ
jgi:hypothetical protein